MQFENNSTEMRLSPLVHVYTVTKTRVKYLFSLNFLKKNEFLYFQFEKNFTEIRVRMVVENWHWGSFGFTTDHFLLDDIGFYCGEMEPFVWTQVHLNHTTLKGSYKGLEENLVKIVTFKEQAGEMKRYCEWIMPSKFKVHQVKKIGKILQIKGAHGTFLQILKCIRKEIG